MGSKRKGGVYDLLSSSDEDDGSKIKKRPVRKTFQIHSTEYVTSSNRDEKKRASAKIVFNVNTTETEIREILIRELPQLGGKRFEFFTKDKAGKWYFCPCSLQCEGKDHLAEWNGRNIPRAAKSNRAVYILIKSTTMEQTRSRRVQNDTPTNPLSTGPQFCSTVGQYSSNPWNQKQAGVVVKNHQSVSCPDLSLSGLEHQENTSVPLLSAKHGNDLNQWPTQLIPHVSQEQTVPETEDGKLKDGSRATEERDGEGEGRIGIGDEEMQTDMRNSALPSSSGYDTISLESSTFVPPEDLNLPMSDEALQLYLDSVLRSPIPALQMEIANEEPARNPFVIEEIVPIKGDIKGGDSFVLCFAEPCMVDHCKVLFGIADPVPVIARGNDYRGKTPPYPTPGEVQVQLVSFMGDPISDTVTFTYTDESAMKKWTIKPQDIQNMDTDDLPLALLEIAIRMGQMRLQLKGNANQPDDSNTEAMVLLRMIADTAAKINAIDFFRIVFSTNVGRSVFKCFKDEQPLLEDIARGNGHDELASLLEEKHLMYQDGENDSDDEVDWKELVKAIGQYQILNGETNEKNSIRSAISSETMYGYLGDRESPTTLSSSDISVADGFPKDTLEDQDQAPLESKCPEEPNTRCARCERLAAEGCPESTFEEQQTTPESTCGEEPDTFQAIAAEGCPENTLEEQQTIPKSRCREKPDTCQTSGRIARGSIPDGMSDTDIINTISSSDQLRMNKAHQIKESQSSIGEKNLLANKYLNPPHLACSGPIIIKNFQMDKFAPKEVSSLRRKLGPFDAAKMNPSALYPDRDQTIYNLMERLDTSPALDFLEDINKQDLTEGLKAQKGSKHQETAKKELWDAKRKREAVMKTKSMTSRYSPLHSKVDSGVKIERLVGSTSNVSLLERSSEEEIDQDVRSFEEHFFEEQFFEASINERRSVYLSSVRRRRRSALAAVLLTLLLIIVVAILVTITLRASTKKQTPTTAPIRAVETVTTSRQACSNGLLTLFCEGVTDINAVHELRWRIKFPDAGWNEFAYCDKSGMNCVVTRPVLPEGIKVLEVSNRSVNLQRITKNNTDGYAQTMCQVLYSDNSRTSHVYKINFTAKCVRIHERRDLNLTKILQSLVQCERAVDIEWYSINGSKFVYCSTCQDCKKISEVNRGHAFWNRLQVTRDSLLLTAIQESDDGRTIRVKVHMKASGKSVGRDVEENMESAHMYTIWIFVNTSRPPGTKTGGTCFDELLIHPCRGLNSLDKTIKDVEWKAKNSKGDRWIRFAYCNGFLTCIVEQPILPNGVKVRGISNGTLTLQPAAKSMTDGITGLKCLVHYSDSTINTPSIVKIHYSNFTVCIRAQKASDVNFTRVLRNTLPWQQVVDIEFYDTSKTKLAHCHTINCTKEPVGSSDAVPVFWNRLRVKKGSLLLTRIKESDGKLEIRVKVHINDNSVRLYTLKILVVNGSQDIDDCINHTCSNDGTCEDGINSYSCNCPLGFTGNHCETDIDDCVNHTCSNNGSCEDGVNSYSCNCPEGYTGDYCETDIDYCINHTCQNGASCVDGLHNYSCKCPTGYTGSNCENGLPSLSTSANIVTTVSTSRASTAAIVPPTSSTTRTSAASSSTTQGINISVPRLTSSIKVSTRSSSAVTNIPTPTSDKEATSVTIQQATQQVITSSLVVTDISSSVKGSTTVTVQSTTPQPETKLVVELRIQRTWNKDLEDESSQAFRELSRTLKIQITEQYSQEENFVGVKILSFRSGSVVAQFQLLFKEILEDEKALNPLKKAVEDGNLGPLTVDPESLKIIKDVEEPTEESKVPYPLIIGVSCGGIFVVAIIVIYLIRYCHRRKKLRHRRKSGVMPAEVAFPNPEKYQLQEIASKEDIVRYEETNMWKDPARYEKLAFSNGSTYHEVGIPNVGAEIRISYDDLRLQEMGILKNSGEK